MTEPHTEVKQPVVQVGETFELEIASLNSQAEGVGRHQGLAVFVSGVLPGERVEVEVCKVSRNFAHARALALNETSQDRVSPKCPVHIVPDPSGRFADSRDCGGCQLQIVSREEELRFKRRLVQETLCRVGSLDLEVEPVVAGKAWGYRNKMAFALAETDGHLSWGLRSLQQGDRTIPLPSCEIARPELWSSAGEILHALDEKFGTGLIWDGEKGYVRGVMVRTHAGRAKPPPGPMDRASLEPCVAAIFAVTSFDFGQADRVAQCLSHLEGVRPFFSFSDPRSTGVYYDRTRFLNRLSDREPFWGEALYLEESMCWHTTGSWPTLVGPTSFLQVNDEMAEKLYQRVLELPFSGNRLAVDAYCGVGVLTRALADRFEEVVGIEFDAQSVKLARTTARRLQDCRVAWVAEPAEAVFSNWRRDRNLLSGEPPDLVVLDPPRKGCQREVLEVLTILRPKDVVYISCHPAALARDLGILCKRHFEVVRIEPFDLFPQTRHVETLVHLKS